MIIAQLQRKVPERFEGMEDVLTSSVFSLLCYLSPSKAIDLLMNFTGLDIRSSSIETLFWPRYPTPPGFSSVPSSEQSEMRAQTEPDVVICTDDYVIFVETKFGSDLDGEYDQLGREFAIGYRLAKEEGKSFALIAVTRDIHAPRPGGVDLVTGLEKKLQVTSEAGRWTDAEEIQKAVKSSFRWRKWQDMWRSLKWNNYGEENRLVTDVCTLLTLQNLAPYDATALNKALLTNLPHETPDYAYSFVMSSAYSKMWHKLLKTDLGCLTHSTLPPLNKEYRPHTLTKFDLKPLEVPIWIINCSRNR